MLTSGCLAAAAITLEYFLFSLLVEATISFFWCSKFCK